MIFGISQTSKQTLIYKYPDSLRNFSFRKSACRLMGKIATKLDAQTLRQDVLPTTLALCQDIDWEVRHLMCRHLALIARGVGQDTTKSLIMPQLVELSSDEISDVRLAAIETVVDLLTVSLLDDESRTQIIVPLVIKSCDQVSRTFINKARDGPKLSL